MTEVHGVYLAGPIAWWWDKFDSPEAIQYRLWRAKLSAALEDSQRFMVYRPHEGLKGKWDSKFQFINDQALVVCTFLLDMRPPESISIGTEGEIVLAKSLGVKVKATPPVVEQWMDLKIKWIVEDLILMVKNLDTH